MDSSYPLVWPALVACAYGRPNAKYTRTVSGWLVLIFWRSLRKSFDSFTRTYDLKSRNLSKQARERFLFFNFTRGKLDCSWSSYRVRRALIKNYDSWTSETVCLPWQAYTNCSTARSQMTMYTGVSMTGVVSERKGHLYCISKVKMPESWIGKVSDCKNKSMQFE